MQSARAINRKRVAIARRGPTASDPGYLPHEIDYDLNSLSGRAGGSICWLCSYGSVYALLQPYRVRAGALSFTLRDYPDLWTAESYVWLFLFVVCAIPNESKLRAPGSRNKCLVIRVVHFHSAMDSRFVLSFSLLCSLQVSCQTFPRLSFGNDEAIPNHGLGMIGTSYSNSTQCRTDLSTCCNQDASHHGNCIFLTITLWWIVVVRTPTLTNSSQLNLVGDNLEGIWFGGISFKFFNQLYYHIHHHLVVRKN